MKLSDFRSLIVSIDPKATRYFAPETGPCTVWAEYERMGLYGDNIPAESGWKVRVDRYTTLEDDPVVEMLTQGLDNDEVTIMSYTVECDPASRIIRHTWLCEVC